MGYQRMDNAPDLAESSVSVSSEDDDDEPLLSEEEELTKHLACLKNKKTAIDLQETVLVQEALQAIVTERERKEAAERARPAAERKRKLEEEEAERQRVKRARV
eukprot:Nitzschia sp. Nitz4//scaffold32_size149145//143217//143528//NITZ4_002903-RA/size149145-processed-gene-0.172-mRNA-1//1//CDS//3329548141//1735//frame0